MGVVNPGGSSVAPTLTGPVTIKRPGPASGANLLTVVQQDGVTMLAQIVDNGEINWGGDAVGNRLRAAGGPIMTGDANLQGGAFTGGGSGFQPGAGSVLFSAAGVPAAGLGVNGDVYFRSDGAAGTTIYQKRAGAWVATAA